MDCPICGNDIRKTQSIGHINRALKMGRNIYCSRDCSSEARRDHLSIEEKKKIKADYDKEYREKNLEYKKQWAKDYFKRTYNPELAKIERKKKYKKHLEYLSTPKYRAWKKEYDLKFRAKKNYGEFWETQIILNNLLKEIDNRQAKSQNQLINKSQKRKRLCKTNKQDYLQTI